MGSDPVLRRSRLAWPTPGRQYAGVGPGNCQRRTQRVTMAQRAPQQGNHFGNTRIITRPQRGNNSWRYPKRFQRNLCPNIRPYKPSSSRRQASYRRRLSHIPLPAVVNIVWRRLAKECLKGRSPPEGRNPRQMQLQPQSRPLIDCLVRLRRIMPGVDAGLQPQEPDSVSQRHGRQTDHSAAAAAARQISS